MHENSTGFRLTVNAQICCGQLCRTDISALIKYLNDSGIYERSMRIPQPYGLADAERFLDIVEQTQITHGHPVHFAIRNSTSELIGGLGFEGLVRGHTAEIGYWLGRPFWGQGIMTDVLRAATRFALDEWQLIRISANVFDFNLASVRVLEKNGYQREGVLRKQYRKDGRFIDSILLAYVV